MAVLYGIKNCDTVKKARKWLDKRQVKYSFHDFRTDGIDEKLLETWIKYFGWENVINTNSSTYRQLPEWQKDLLSEETVLGIMLEHPTIIKRPVIKKGRVFEIGFSEEKYNELF
ncbi:MAG: ArsC family reductase [Thiohalomonadales bacterium]